MLALTLEQTVPRQMNKTTVKATKQEIIIKTRKRGDIKVIAEVYGLLAIHPDHECPRAYNLTHIPTGYSLLNGADYGVIQAGLSSTKVYKQIIKAIEDQKIDLNWTDVQKASDNGIGRQLGLLINSFAKSHQA